MKGILLLNGEPYDFIINTDDAYVICLDGAKKWADNKGVRYDVVVGDFDSLGYTPKGALVYPTEKDYSDGELGLNLLLDRKVDKIEIYGGGGKRDDHYFCNVGLLIKAYKKGVKTVFYTNYTEFFVADGKVLIQEKTGTYVSIVPVLDKVCVTNSVGLKYSLDNLTITRGESRGLSNVIIGEFASFEVVEGAAIVFVVRSERAV